MLCNQCQETVRNKGCTAKGVCGKSEATANVQDLLIYACRGLAAVAVAARQQGIDTLPQARHVTRCLFMTITNANFDDEPLLGAVEECLALRDELKGRLPGRDWPEAAVWRAAGRDGLHGKAAQVGIATFDRDEDVRALKQYVLYGLKGMAAYAEHAANLGHEDPEIYAFMADSLAMIDRPMDRDAMLAWLLRTGEFGVRVMALLDKANTAAYGKPEVTQVDIGAGRNPGILVSGHDLKDLEQLLLQSAGQGIDVYTHSEMLPAHAYPQFKKYPHLAGNYGNAWHRQLEEFESFNGPILFTSNCLVPPRRNAAYAGRVFTTGAAGMPGWKHLDKRRADGQKDFSEIIALARTCPPPRPIEQGRIPIGFAHDQVLALADQVLAAVQSGAIRKFVVMSGCDARQRSREYYGDFARSLPADTVILTSGCAKYRYNKLNLGAIGGIPRVLDAGQCNDSYSWALVALALKDALKLDDINQLPIAFNIAWYEQKAIIVHLALLYLGIRNTHIGPTLPEFLTPGLLKILGEKFGVQTIATVDQDLKAFGLPGAAG